MIEAEPALLSLARAVTSLVLRGEVLPLPLLPHLVAAVSGGSDSTGLIVALDVLRSSCPFPLTAVHVNYRLRGEDADADQRFVEDLCRRLGVELLVHRVDASELEALRRGGTQDVARRIRRRVLHDAAVASGGVVTLGHTRDDRIEGFFLGLLRGAGLEALGGMLPLSSEGLARPLLELGHDEIRLWLSGRGETWREDASNASDAYLRNRIRHRLLPLLEELRPGACDVVVRTQEVLSRDGGCLRSQARDALARLLRPEPGEGLSLPLSGLMELPPAIRARTLREFVRGAGGGESALSHGATDELLGVVARGREGQGWTRRRPVVTVSRGRLWAYGAPPSSWAAPVPSAGTLEVGGWRFLVSPVEAWSGGRLDVPREGVALVVGDLVPPLSVRCAEAGDRVLRREGGRPASVTGLLGRAGVPLPLRKRWPILVDGRGILWVPGVGSSTLVGRAGPGSRVLVVERVP